MTAAEGGDPAAAGMAQALGRWRAGDHAGARDLCAQYLKVAPQDLAALNLFAMVSASLGDSAGAVAALRKAVALCPADAILCNNLGNALLAAGSTGEAIDWLRKATSLAPGYSDGHANLGNALQSAGRLHQAVMAYRRAIEHNPQHIRSHYQLGNALRKSGQLRPAAAAYDNAVQLAPAFVEALQNQAGCLMETGQFTAALAVVKRLVVLRGDCAECLYMLGVAHQGVGDLKAAADAFERSLAREPKNLRCLVASWRLQRRMCEWVEADRTWRRLQEARAAGEPLAAEWIPLLAANPDEALRMARSFAEGRFSSVPLPARVRQPNAKMRIGYIGVDFREAQTPRFLADVLRHHDRGAFEIAAVSFTGPPHDEEARKWLRDTFSPWLDAREQSDEEVIAWLRDAALDIAVDVQGYGGGREQVMGNRIAPVQMQYLGFGGSMGSEHMDYLLADDLLVPPAESGAYTEQLIYLPGAYCLGDDGPRAPRAEASRRADFGLPTDAFLFACLSPGSSIDAPVFDAWMRLLCRVPRAVFCLADHNRWTVDNLRQAAAARGVAVHRLLFSPPLSEAARRRYLSMLDLYLDTPDNCPEAVSDALQSGLPALALHGATFWNRRSASLLRSAGLSALITATIADYEACALRLSADERSRRALGEQLRTADPSRAPTLCAALERAYRAAIAARAT